MGVYRGVGLSWKVHELTGYTGMMKSVIHYNIMTIVVFTPFQLLNAFLSP